MLEESNGVFAKRRRNLIIVGAIIIVLAVAKPSITEVELFGMDFNFIGRDYLIWIGLSIWLLYSTVRVYSYYISHSVVNLQKHKRLFIYKDDRGLSIWDKKAKNRIINLKNLFGTQKPSNSNHIKVRDVVFNGSLDGQLQPMLELGVIPGEATINVIFRYWNSGDYHTTLNIDFNLDEENKKYFKQRKRKYLISDAWWEYRFLWFFVFAAYSGLIIGWLRVLICNY